MKRTHMHHIPLMLALFSLLLSLVGCQQAYYGAMEQVGVHKREILRDRVEEARDTQGEAKEEFASALERFGSVVQVDGGALEDKYYELEEVYDDCEDKAADVRRRVDAVEDVAEALFEEWEEELELYSSAELRAESKRRLRDTRSEYDQMITAMRRAEQSMAPVLETFQDQVLFLKHNLNAKAIASIRGELDTVERDVNMLIADMEASIAEANRFIEGMLAE